MTKYQVRKCYIQGSSTSVCSPYWLSGSGPTNRQMCEWYHLKGSEKVHAFFSWESLKPLKTNKNKSLITHIEIRNFMEKKNSGLKQWGRKCRDLQNMEISGRMSSQLKVLALETAGLRLTRMFPLSYTWFSLYSASWWWQFYWAPISTSELGKLDIRTPHYLYCYSHLDIPENSSLIF